MDLEIECSFDEPFYDIQSPKPVDIPIDRYTIIKDLTNGQANYSFVYSCNDTYVNKKKAIKFIKLTKKLIDRIKNEIIIMRILHHSNIIQMEEYFREGPYICIVLPYTRHRSLSWFLTQYYRDGINEELALPMIKQMISAVSHLHLNNICHRDIKPDNFLIFDDRNDDDDDLDDIGIFYGLPRVVLTDFGFANHFCPNEFFTDFLGTHDYLAPEIINDESYDQSVDIWALGIVIFKMLTGELPFPSFHLSPTNCFKHITSGKLNFKLLRHKNVSIEAQNLIESMCKVNPKERIKANEALHHSLFLIPEKPQIMKDMSDHLGNLNEYADEHVGT